MFFGLVPLLIYGIFHTGVLALLVFGMGLLAALLWERLFLPRAPRRIQRSLYVPSSRVPTRKWLPTSQQIKLALCAVLCVFTVFGAVISIPMIGSASTELPQNATVIVLGAQVIGDQPSKMLRLRLDTACEYLRAHPLSQVICAGGSANAHTPTEAQVMRQYLIDNGIQKERIHLEESSRNTEQNLRFSAQILRKQALPEQVVIATDGFHQYRAAIYARRQGLAPAALSAPTPWGLAPSYWVREWFALTKAAFTTA